MLLLRKILFSTALLFAVGLSSVSLAQSAADRFRVEAILVEGNERVTDATILAYLPIKTGDEIDLQALDQAIGSLFATNLFENVSISRSGNQVIIEIVENPIISRINIEGNDVLTDERLLAELDVQPRRVYTAEVARTATQRLLEIYRLSGRFAASVVPKIIRQDNNRVDLVFEVDEGPLIKIQSIRFLGNSAFSDYALRQIISSRVERWWALFSSTDKYDPGRLDYDVRLLRQFYLSRGYADIDVVRAQGGLLSDRSGFAVTFSLKEGPRYRLKDISFTSEIESVDVSQLRDLIQLEEGDWYDVRAIEEGLLNITNELGNFGYAFVNVTPEVFTDPETQTLNVQINIGAATKNFVERIEVINNSRTLDNVVRRELELVEGDAYNQLKIDRSLRKVRGLGFFRKVDVQTLPGSTEDQSVVQFDVEEQPTGNFSVGLGYSSIDKTTLSLGIKERNFLGSGRATNFAISTSDTRADYRVGLTEPYLFDRNLRGSIELFKEQVKETTVEVETQGLQTSASFNAARDYYQRFGYGFVTKDTVQKSTTATSVTGDEGRSTTESTISYTLGRDTLNNRFDPSEGYLLEASQDYAGIGGDVNYLRTNLRAAYYQPYFFNSLVLGVRGRAGFVEGLDEKVSQSGRFFLGGRQVRGFDGSGIGPRDTGTDSAVGGNYMYSGSVELISSLGLSDDLGIRWTLFSDFGSVWDTDYPTGVTGADDDKLRQSIGFGFLWDTAIGPLTFYWADAISKSSHDQLKRFQFNIGTRF